MNYRSRFFSRHLGRILVFASISLLAACTSILPASYPPINTSIGDIKEWRMPLNREPGQVQFKLLIPRKGTTEIALTAAQKLGEGPILVSFSGYECSTGPEAFIKFYTSDTESHYKYFRTPLAWENEVTLSIEWDKDARTSVSVNKEMITVQPAMSFAEVQVTNKKEPVKIKELHYAPRTAHPPSN